MTEDEVLDQPLQKENTSTDKLNAEDNQQLFTKQIESNKIKLVVLKQVKSLTNH